MNANQPLLVGLLQRTPTGAIALEQRRGALLLSKQRPIVG